MPDIATMTTTTPTRFDLLRLLGLDPAAVAAGIVRDLLADAEVFHAVRHFANRLDDLGVSLHDAAAVQEAIVDDAITGALAAGLAVTLKRRDHAPPIQEPTPCFDPFPY